MPEKEIPKELEQKINQLQLFEQNLQNYLNQKQQFQLQIIEIKSALKEIENAKEAYKIVGGIMVLAKKDEIEAELNSKKEIADLRIKSLEKQENQIKEKATKLQSEVMEKLKANG